MNWFAIIAATAAVAIVGLIIGLLLGIAAKKLEVKQDKKLSRIIELLPNNNCGGCGYAGCADLAKAIFDGNASASSCPVGGINTATAISEVLGSSSEFIKKTAFVHCLGNCNNTEKKYNYYGEKSCELMDFVPGRGEKQCAYACLGYGSCVKACEFDAITISDGVAVVDADKCGGCGACVKACPKKIISLVSQDKKIRIACSSKDIGKVVIKACETGCIACKKCERTCPKGAIKLVNNLPVIDYSLCVGCGLCVKDCPRNIIIKI